MSRPEYVTTGEGFDLGGDHEWDMADARRDDFASGEQECRRCHWRRKSYGDTPGLYSHTHDALGGWAGFYCSTVPPCEWFAVVDGRPDWWSR